MTHEEIINEIHADILKYWPPNQIQEFFAGPWKGESLTKHHHDLGRYIRNKYRLWEIPWEPEMKEFHGCMCDCSPYHPDQVSTTIIEEVWKKGYTKMNTEWCRAKKTKGLRAKAMINLIVDKSVVNSFLLDTLEGREPVGPSSMFCIGAAGDAWQQSPKALLKKYDIKDIDNDGWMVCEPKPDNEVQFIENGLDQYITGHWGETVDGIPNQQWCKVGDFVLRNPADITDMWVVQRKLFNNTYSILGE